MNVLKRSLAPFPKEAWDFIDEEAREVLELKLKGRNIVDFKGPKGLDYAAINTGRFLPMNIDEVDGVTYASREVLPLMEIKVPFKMKLAELEALARGAEDVDTDPLLEAAAKLAKAENEAILFGLKKVGINGIIEAAEQEPVEVSVGPNEMMNGLLKAKNNFDNDGVKGPYHLLMGREMYSLLYELDDRGYPLRRKVEELVGNEAIMVPELNDKGLLVSARGGDFEMTVGQDISIGYSSQDQDEVELFFLETFTFRVNGPEAATVLK